MAVSQKVLANQTTTGQSATFNPDIRTYEFTVGVFQVEITGTASVNIEGRSDSTAPWTVLNTYTATGANAVQWMPQMRVNVTSISSGAVNAWATMTPMP